MNKVLIVILAVCLVTVHGFVKRDAPANSEINLDTIKKQLSDFGETINKELSAAFKPETIKKNFDETMQKISSTIDSFKTKADAPK